MGVTKIFQICKNMELRENQEWTNMNKNANITDLNWEEFNIVIDNKNIALSRENLLSHIWGYDFYGDDRTVDTHVKTLRKHLGKYKDMIVTVRGMGYKFLYEE